MPVFSIDNYIFRKRLSVALSGAFYPTGYTKQSETGRRIIVDFDFDRIIERRGTDSLKWHVYRERDVLPMWVADMDFASPECVLEALRRRVNHSVFGYAVDTDALNETAVNWTYRRYDWQIQPEWIIWLPGLVPALHVMCLAFAGPGEEVATFIPVYPPFLAAPKRTGRGRQTIPLKRENGRYTFDLDALQQTITPTTKVLLLCHPFNPVGRAFEREELEGLKEVCQEHDLIVCSDEIHCDLILADKPHIPFLTLDPALAQRTVTLMSPAKTFNLAGLNCGLAVIPDEHLRRKFKQTMEGLVPHPNVLGYASCRAAYEDGEPWRQALVQYLRQNRDLLEDFLRSEMPMLKMDHVEATYLAWIDARQLAVKQPGPFFEKAGVGLSDGRYFQGKGFVRLNFGCPQSRLLDALERMKSALMNPTPTT